jgi:poly(3-hydroxybutyrate) depolymerase
MASMISIPFPALAVVVALLWPGNGALAAEIKTLSLSDGTEIEYALVVPGNFRKDRAYPAILAFPGGRQSIRGAGGTLDRFWEREAVKRGYIVISPAAAEGKPYFGEGALLIPEFLRHFLDAYRIAGGRFHIGGHSNGAVSAFRVASLYPEMFLAITVFAGFPEEAEDFDRLDKVKDMKVTMFVGDGDQYWKEGMIRVRERLRELGNDAYLEIVPRNGHLVPDLTYENSWKIFDRFEGK